MRTKEGNTKIKDKVKRILEGQRLRAVGQSQRKSIFITDIDELATTDEIVKNIIQTEEIKNPENQTIRSTRQIKVRRQTASNRELDISWMSKNAIDVGRMDIKLTHVKNKVVVETARDVQKAVTDGMSIRKRSVLREKQKKHY
ncbi:hypothetical protein FQR65_LT12224 [Abscondita terminalis]|nr:hypothetical protein FQR65_LT12224 [Abscondita terminalis]